MQNCSKEATTRLDQSTAPRLQVLRTSLFMLELLWAIIGALSPSQQNTRKMLDGTICVICVRAHDQREPSDTRLTPTRAVSRFRDGPWHEWRAVQGPLTDMPIILRAGRGQARHCSEHRMSLARVVWLRAMISMLISVSVHTAPSSQKQRKGPGRERHRNASPRKPRAPVAPTMSSPSLLQSGLPEHGALGG